MSSGFRKLIFLLVLLGTAYVAFQYMIKPANKRIAEQKLRVQQKLDKLARFEQARAKVKDLDAQVEQLQDAVAFFESKLPPSSDIHKVLKQVTVIAQQQGLKTKSIKTLPLAQSNGYIEQPLKMELSGDYIAYYSFMTELERMDRITRVRELELRKQPKNEGQANATFTMSIFFQQSTI